MRIGELAEQAGVSVRALRYYEEQQLLASTRSPSGQRLYPEAAVDRVRHIQRFYAAGLSSKAIGAILPCMDAPSPHHTASAWERMRAERARLDEHIAELQTTRALLDDLIAGRGCDPDDAAHRERQLAAAGARR